MCLDLRQDGVDFSLYSHRFAGLVYFLVFSFELDQQILAWFSILERQT
jgi:hypothetical protein